MEPFALTQTRVIDLFAGAGGLSLGLERAGFEVVRAVEFGPDAAETYAVNHPNTELFECDIREVSFRDLAGEVDLVAGGPPCQPFSTGGKRLGGADPRDGFPEMLRVVREVEPETVLIENVAGLASVTGRPYLDDVVASLQELGFKVEWKVVDAADFGVPQHRRRLILVGVRQTSFTFPAASFGPDAEKPWISSGAVLDPSVPLGEPNLSVVTYARRPDLRPSPYDGHLFNGGGRPLDLARPSRTILASAGGNKTHFIDTHNVVPDYHETLLAGGSPRQGVVPGARRLTVAESAALQTFPPEATFAGSRSSQYSQIGNAVPPLLAAALGEALAAQLSKEAPTPV